MLKKFIGNLTFLIFTYDQNMKIKCIILFTFLISSSLMFSQRLSDEKLKESIEMVISKMDLPFEIPGTDVTMIDVTTVGRNILYTYEVGEYWYPAENGREQLIESLTDKEKKIYIEQEVGLMYHYVRGKSIISRVYIPSSELGQKTKLTDWSLREDIKAELVFVSLCKIYFVKK